jgi:hypothetical protein
MPGLGWRKAEEKKSKRGTKGLFLKLFPKC